MKIIKSILVFLLIVSVSNAVIAEDSYQSEVDQYIRVNPFSKGQKDRYDSLIRQISVIQTKIESYYEHLNVNSEESDCLSFYGGQKIYCDFYKIRKDGITYIPLWAAKETKYGVRQRIMYNELAYFKWEGKKIVNFYFETRKGYLGTIRVLTRLFYGNSIISSTKVVDEKKPPMGLVVNEVLPTGKGTFAQFAFSTKDRVFDKKKDTLLLNGKTLNISTMYLREPVERLKIVRKYLDLLKRLEVRLQWNVHAKNTRRQAELDRVLRDSY